MIDLFFPPKPWELPQREPDLVHLIDKQTQPNKGGRAKLYTPEELLKRERIRKANRKAYLERVGK